MSNNYWENQIKKQEEWEKVRENIWMYIWSPDSKWLHHLFYEILSNSIDESLAWYCNKINITINQDGSLTLEDNWRGIPVWYKEKWKSLIEEIFTIVHMGWKFDREWYEYSWGKHWVWTTVVNYLSDYLEIEIKRDWNHYKLKFEDWKIKEKTSIIWKTNETWTKITFKPSEKYLTTTTWSYEKINNILNKQHFLTNWLEYNLKQLDGKWEIINEDNYLNEEWLTWYIKSISKTDDKTFKTIWNIIEVRDKIIQYENPLYKKEEKLKLSIAFQFSNQAKNPLVAGYTNNIYQPEGWTHVEWLKNLIYLWLKNAINSSNLKVSWLKDAIKQDFLNWLIWIVSINLSKPTLEWQTKNKLWDDFVEKIIKEELKEEVENLLLEDLKNLEKIANHVETNIKTRKAIENIWWATLKKNKDPRLDPDTKLVDAENKDRWKCELFIVEWDSAWGWLEEMRNSQFEWVYKLKWKPKNSITTKAQEILDNKELRNLIYAIWTWIWKNFDVSKLRYWKIFILSDADPDGGHIQSLLLWFFKKFMPQLFSKKILYRVIPPLFYANLGKEKYYLKDKKELKEFEEKNAWRNYSVWRFKGLWEMDPEVLYDTCINSKNRIIERITDDNVEENEEFLEWILWSNPEFKYAFLKNYKENEELLEKKKTSNKEIEEISKETMYDYWMYINQERAIPHLEDWLKPVHKRILYAMNKFLNLKADWRKIKSATVIWSVLWKLHPHWDLSVYWAAVKLTQDFYMKNPLIQKQWNFWSVFWFWQVAAYRYTEMTLSKFSEDILLQNLSDKEQIVPFSNNFDWTNSACNFTSSLINSNFLNLIREKHRYSSS